MIIVSVDTNKSGKEAYGSVEPVTLILAFAIGFSAGILSGMFGIGGGIIMVPALIAAGIIGQFNVATAASLFAIIFLSPTGSYVHFREKHLNVPYGLVLGLAGIFGGITGSYASNYLQDNWLEGGFAVFALFMGAQMAINHRNNRPGAPVAGGPCPAPDEKEPTECRMPNPWPVLAALGFGAGVLAGFMGVGGGLIMVPVMVILGVGIHVAVGTSLLAIIFTASASVATKAAILPSLWPVLLSVAIPLAVGGSIAAYIGANVAERTGSRKLSKYFSVLLFSISAYMIVRALGYF